MGLCFVSKYTALVSALRDSIYTVFVQLISLSRYRRIIAS